MRETLTMILIAVLAGLLSESVRRLALRANVIDLPNERSSHSVPTPRGGGIALVAATLFGVWMFRQADQVPSWLMLGLCVPGLAVAVLGLIDDLVQLPALTRLLAHSAACVTGLLLLPPLALPGFAAGPAAALLAGIFFLLAMIWAVNLYNFMDGIDGLAATEAVFVGCMLVGLSAIAGDFRPGLPAATIAASALGFLAVNWPPARLFMGDSGSGFLGYALAYASLATISAGVSIWSVTIVVAAFVTDATVTLAVRVSSGQKAYQAHRTHAYQHLSRRWGSHRTVTLLTAAINVFWLAPLAAYAQFRPNSGLATAAIAYAPLIGAVIWVGAGRQGNSRRLSAAATLAGASIGTPPSDETPAGTSPGRLNGRETHEIRPK